MTIPLPDTGFRLTDFQQLALAITAENQIGYAQAQTATGTTQATALAIGQTFAMFEVTTTASGTGVMLPISSPGKRQFIANAGANTLTIYTNTGETATSPKINTTAGATGVSQTTGTNGLYVCMTAGQWYRISGT